MFLDRGSHQISPAGSFIHAGEELNLLVAVVPIYAVVPGDAVVHEIGLVSRRQARSLLVNTVESPDERVVTYRHFRRFKGNWIRL